MATRAMCTIARTCRATRAVRAFSHHVRLRNGICLPSPHLRRIDAIEFRSRQEKIWRAAKLSAHPALQVWRGLNAA
jgi:hypothetical protein